MYRSLHSIAMAAVLAHIVLGCCCHHTHASHSADGDQVAEHTCPHKHSGVDRPHATPSCDAADHETPRREVCDQRDCFFVRPDDPVSVNVPTLLDTLLPRLLAANCCGQPLAIRHFPIVGIARPVRLHLLKRVLLI